MRQRCTANGIFNLTSAVTVGSYDEVISWDSSEGAVTMQLGKKDMLSLCLQGRKVHVAIEE